MEHMMINVVIVDDEAPIREWLEMCVEKAGGEYRLMGSFRNGEEALAFLKEHKPDIVFTDIIMPKLDGLELLKEISNLYENVNVVILTSHNEFEFARQAVKNGAEDYFLKAELEKKSIHDILHKLSKKIGKVKASDSSQSVNMLSIGEYMRNIIHENIKVTFEELHQNNIILQNIPYFTVSINHNVKEIYECELVTSTMLKNQIIFIDRNGELVVIVNIDKQYDPQITLERIMESLRGILNKKTDLGYSSIYTDSADLSKSYDEARAMRKYLEYLPDRIYSQNIKKAIAYINENYISPISLQDVAKAVALNEEYLSRLFKKETKWNYSEYLNIIRLKKAERLVKTTDLKVHEIANQVGIMNSAYFTQLFKKEFGMSPSMMRLKQSEN